MKVLKTTKEGNSSTVFLSGSIDIPGAELLRRTLEKIRKSGARNITLDWTEVSYVGMSGIGALIVAGLGRKDAGIQVVNFNKEIAELIRQFGLAHLFGI